MYALLLLLIYFHTFFLFRSNSILLHRFCSQSISIFFLEICLPTTAHPIAEIQHKIVKMAEYIDIHRKIIKTLSSHHPHSTLTNTIKNDIKQLHLIRLLFLSKKKIYIICMRLLSLFKLLQTDWFTICIKIYANT